MKVISVMNFKGGVGKTTTATNLSYLLSEKNLKTLIIDADPSGNASYFYGKYNEEKPSLSWVLREHSDLSKTIRRTKYKNLDIVQSNNTLVGTECSCFLLENQLKKIEEQYDFVIIDCHPSLEDYTIAALVASDLCIMPIKLDQYAINGIELMDDQIGEIEKITGRIRYKILITQFQKSVASRKGYEELVTLNRYPIFRSVIRRTVKVDESTYKRKPLEKCARNSTAAEDYRNFTEELLQEVKKNGLYD